jgi:light-harvesting complex I chlorophyll a/b binding protein 2
MDVVAIDLCTGSDPESLRWNVQAELVHCRWAMLGAAGIFIPEFLTKIGVLNTPFWYTAGEQQYFTDTTTLFIIELILIGWAEGRRWADIIKPGSVNTDPIFPSNKLTGTDVGYVHLSLSLRLLASVRPAKKNKESLARPYKRLTIN